MPPYIVGVLHPGEMGISIAASAQNSGQQVCWASAGRGDKTAARAAKLGLHDRRTLAQLCAECSILVSVCPPHAAEAQAQAVIATGYQGLYVDANAIAPQRAERIGEAMAAAGIPFVDGGIIGGPAWKPGETWLYLSGPQAEMVAACFAAGPLATRVISSQIGKASALKMCYAAYTKGTTALLAAILAAAERLEVRPELYAQWAQEDASFAQQTNQRVQRVTAKAWRFVGEMEEIAATFQSAGQPAGFHLAAAEVYQRLADFKAAPAVPALDEVLAALSKTTADADNNGLASGGSLLDG
jgi:3-hydroxyisobutyrate dehydrogenase-like beta-hydroxyacid dehydrogenase